MAVEWVVENRRLFELRILDRYSTVFDSSVKILFRTHYGLPEQLSTRFCGPRWKISLVTKKQMKRTYENHLKQVSYFMRNEVKLCEDETW